LLLIFEQLKKKKKKWDNIKEEVWRFLIGREVATVL